jgi:hypothetical protein
VWLGRSAGRWSPGPRIKKDQKRVAMVSWDNPGCETVAGSSAMSWRHRPRGPLDRNRFGGADERSSATCPFISIIGC